MTRFLNIFPAILFLLLVPLRGEAVLEFVAEVDRDKITADESVQLIFKIVSDEGNFSLVGVRYKAPGFDELNTFENSFTQYRYDGQTSKMEHSKTITKVLRPKKKGRLKIYDIKVQAGNRVLKAKPLYVRVLAQTPAQKSPKLADVDEDSEFFLQAELNKPRVFKGEQLVVSYYLYRRVRVFNLEVTKYPVLTGFLREDLQMPVLQRRLNSQPINVNGVSFRRSLLARYAAYPLQTGRLKIDSMSVKTNYYPRRQQQGGTNDPFFQLFKQLNPLTSTRSSQHLSVQVEPLPAEGKPESFSGGVGNFSVVSAANKTDVKAHEALTVTVKVEGKGNVAAIGEPKIEWPRSVDLFESKGNAKSGKAGIGSKVFEYVLIPRQEGELVLPPIEFAFFDPGEKKYVSQSTNPINIRVLPGDPGAAPARSKSFDQPLAQKEEKKQDIRHLKLKPYASDSLFHGKPWWRWMYWGFSFVFVFFLGLILFDLFRARVKKALGSAGAIEKRKKKEVSGKWKDLWNRANAATNSASWDEVSRSYEILSEILLEGITESYGFAARSHSRSELSEILVEKQGMPSETWKRIESLLDFAELVRFAGSGAGLSQDQAREDLSKWVSEGQSLSNLIGEKRRKQEGKRNHYEGSTNP